MLSVKKLKSINLLPFEFKIENIHVIEIIQVCLYVNLEISMLKPMEQHPSSHIIKNLSSTDHQQLLIHPKKH